MWKDVAGYEGCYMVSNFGRVMSLGREVPNSDKSNRIIRPSIMSLNIKNAKRKSSIYQTYTAHLCKNRIRKAITVHRLVACAFIENPNNYPSIDHIDGNPMNNHVSNLRWCTNTINMNNPITRSRISLSKKGKYNTPKSMPVVQIMFCSCNPKRLMLQAASKSRSFTDPQLGHTHSLSESFSPL